MLQIWLLCERSILSRVCITHDVRTVRFSHALWLNRNRKVTKFAAFVHVVCGIMRTKFCSKRTTFDKLVVKKLLEVDRRSIWSAIKCAWKNGTLKWFKIKITIQKMISNHDFKFFDFISYPTLTTCSTVLTRLTRTVSGFLTCRRWPRTLTYLLENPVDTVF